MKVKTFYLKVGTGSIEDELNRFIEGKKVIDIKMASFSDPSIEAQVLEFMVMYEEK
jgi:hypothetical protein